jgi:hypothetical protein
MTDVVGAGTHPHLREERAMMVAALASATSRSRATIGMSAGFTLCAGSTRKIWWVLLAVIQSS